MRRKGSLLKFHVAQRGHIYFIVCGNGICKIGASTNPVARIRDQISLNGELTYPRPAQNKNAGAARVVEVFVSAPLEAFRVRERQLQSHFCEWRYGPHCRAETFLLPPAEIDRLRRIAFGEFSELSFAELVNPDTGLNSREAVAA
jgi:hypothetical protein